MKYDLKTIPVHIKDQATRTSLAMVNVYKVPLLESWRELNAKHRRLSPGLVNTSEMEDVEKNLIRLDANWDKLIVACAKTKN